MIGRLWPPSRSLPRLSVYLQYNYSSPSISFIPCPFCSPARLKLYLVCQACCAVLCCGSTGGRLARHMMTVMASWRSAQTRQSNVDLRSDLFWRVAVGRAGHGDPKAGSWFPKQFLVPMPLKMVLQKLTKPLPYMLRISTDGSLQEVNENRPAAQRGHDLFFLLLRSDFSLSRRRLIRAPLVNSVH